MNRKRANVIMTLVIIMIIIIISTIFYLKNGNVEEKTIKCISSKGFFFSSKTCTACAYQKEILGEYVNLVDIRDVAEHPEAFTEYNIPGTPTWIINEKQYPGARTIEQLKEITGC